MRQITKKQARQRFYKKVFLIGLPTIGLLVFLIITVLVNDLYMKSKINPQINFTIGTCLYRSHHDNTWQKASIGIKVKKGYEFKTGNNSAMDILIQDGTAVRITDNSIMHIPKIGLNEVSFSLQAGSLYGKLKKLKRRQNLTIRTKTAVASIRGTQLCIKYSNHNFKTKGYCLKGVIDFYNESNKNKSITLTRHLKSSTTGNNFPANPEKMSKLEISYMQKIIDSIKINQMLFVTSKITFAPGSSEINKSSKTALDSIFKVLNKTEKGIIQIAGHTDTIGNPVLNKQLSLKRAKAIQQYMIKRGFDLKRLTVIGHGDTQPLYSNKTPIGRSKNRRVEFTIIKK